jgi:HEAT repeat protein
MSDTKRRWGFDMNMIRQFWVIGFLLTGVVVSSGQEQPKPNYAAKSLEKWIDALTDLDHPELRLEARKALGPDGPYVKVAVRALIEALGHKERLVSSDTAETLADYGPRVVPSLVRALQRPEASVRATVAEALGYMRPRVIEAVPVLLKAIKDPAPEVRYAAAFSLGNIKRPPERIVPALISALRDDHDEVREAAANALSEMVRKVRPAVPALIVALKDKSHRVRESAAQALWQIGPDAKTAVPELIEALQDKKNGFSRSAMAMALGRIGPAANAAVPTLIEVLQEKDKSLRLSAMQALGEIGPGAKAAVPALIAAAKDKANEGSDQAIAALGEIGPEAWAAVPVLMDALADRQWYGYAVARALGGIGPAAKAAVPTLAKIARSQLDGDHIADGPTRQAAAEAVMKINPEYGAKHGIALSYLDVRLGKIAPVKLAPRGPLTEEKKRHIKRLIVELAGLAQPDFGLSATLTGHAFAPLPDRGQFDMGLLTDHQLKTFDPFRKLVEIGPDALPFLLDALGDKTPTKLKVESGMMTGFGAELEGNPLNAVERRVLAEESANAAEDQDGDEDAAAYMLKVGDVCFVAIGQIVGRRYNAVRYQPTAIVIINSPVQSANLRRRVRAILSSSNPAQELLDSLLIDYATEGIFNGKSLDGWSDGSDRQIEAAVRLLYYFPNASAPLIVERLKRMDITRPKPGLDGWMLREVANGVCTTDFLKAVSWCMEPAIQKALLDIFLRTNDAEVKLAVLPSVKESRPDLIIPRLRAVLRQLPESEEDARGDGYRLLLALGRYAGQAAKADYEEYLRGGSLQRRWTMCWVLEKAHPEWTLELLTPFLTDKRTGFASKKVRLCDMAASTLSQADSELRFDVSDDPAKMDRQIEQMLKQIAQKRNKKP